MASEKTPLIINNPSADSLVGSGPPTPTNNVVHGSSDSQPTVYFLERRPSDVSHHTSSHRQNTDAEEIETIPEGSRIEEFQPRPVSAGSLAGSSKSPSHRSSHKSWLDFFKNVNKKSHAFAAIGGTTPMIDSLTPHSAPFVKIDPKVFFANERTFLAWMHVSVILAGASVAIGAFTEASDSVPHQLYGLILLPVSIAFILYAMMQYSRRATMIRRKATGPYVDIVGPTVLTVILMISIVAQFSIKLYTMMYFLVEAQKTLQYIGSKWEYCTMGW